MFKGKFRWLKIILAVLGAFVFIIAATIFILSEPLPQGKEGAEAQQLAQQLLSSINYEAWENTGAVSWNFGDRHQFVWDRHRHYTEVKWENYRVLVDLNQLTGVAYQSGARVLGEENDKLVKKAWAYWANDSFWLNAPAKVLDEGTTHKTVETEDGKALMITYSSGGVTPGDTYLWFFDSLGIPMYFKMWVSIIPIGGAKASWEDWTTTQTGAKISTKHDLGGLYTLLIKDIKTADHLGQLTHGNDIFKEL